MTGTRENRWPFQSQALWPPLLSFCRRIIYVFCVDNYPYRNLSTLWVSLTVQLILAFLFGNFYDMRVSLAAGYTVGTGGNPYIAQDLSAVFHNELFHGISTIGYPPPWTMVLGLIYRGVYAVFPNFLLYNFAIKIPIIAANACLAYLTAHVAGKLGAEGSVVNRTRNFMLLNPTVLIFSSAWGQIDSMVALISLAAMVLLYVKKLNGSAILLALAISLKPIALPIAAAVFVYVLSKNYWKMARFFLVFLAGMVVFCVLPFVILGWNPAIVFRNWNAHFAVAGCMSFMSISEIGNKTFELRQGWRVLGMLWAPALIGFAVYFLRFKLSGFRDLLTVSTAMILVFFLTKTWISEPNVLLLLPFILILNAIGKLDRFALTLLWGLPLVFSFFNGSLAALMFPTFPRLMSAIFAFGNDYRVIRLIARSIVTLPWLITGWWIVIICSKKSAFVRAISSDGARKTEEAQWN